MEIADREAKEYEDVVPCSPDPSDASTLDQANLRLPCPRNISLNIATLGGVAFSATWIASLHERHWP